MSLSSYRSGAARICCARFATIGDIVHIHSAVGEAVFELEGVQHRLLIMVGDGQESGSAGVGTVPFVDGTGGLTTDPRGRSLAVAFPAEAGPLTLDFNFAQNLQRPYTVFSPCPLPPPRRA
ncbi:MAG: hypothetical protein JWN20_1970 [Jatrophihabitantaceae bacterium]|nr:hypothetical protein [Jatrophihabitantaceae bacterium]